MNHLANLLPPDLIANITSYIPLFELDNDGYLYESLNRFLTNIGIPIEERIYITRKYFDDNLQVLQDILHCNFLTLDDVNEHLSVFNESQINDGTKFISIIELSHNNRSPNQVSGLIRFVVSFLDDDGEERLDRDVVLNHLDELIQQDYTDYGVPVLKVKSTDESLLRAIDNNSVLSMSREDMLDHCMDKFDNGHSGIALYVTNETTRSRFIDVTFVNPIIARMNRLDPICQAWHEITRRDSVVSDTWGDRVMHLHSRPHTTGRERHEVDMFVSSNVAGGLVFGENTNPLLFSPVVEIIRFKRIPMNNTEQIAWKIVVTDGTKLCTGLVPERLVHHVNSGELKLHAVIKVLEFTTASTSGGHRLFVLLGMEFMYQHKYRIAHPIDIQDDVRD